MSRRGNVYVKNILAGVLEETDSGRYVFQYDSSYFKTSNAQPVSLTLPLQTSPYESERLFSFFDGIIPEGWLLDITVKNWKIAPDDRMGLLLSCCRDCIGTVHIEPVDEEVKSE